MKKFVLFLLLSILFVGGCTQENNSSSTDNSSSQEKSESSSQEYVNIENSEKVKIKYNGEVYDLTPYIECTSVSECTNNNEIDTNDNLSMLEEELNPPEINNAKINDELTVVLPEALPNDPEIVVNQHQAGTGIMETVVNKTIEISGEKGEEITYVMDMKWRLDEGSLASSVTYMFEVPSP